MKHDLESVAENPAQLRWLGLPGPHSLFLELVSLRPRVRLSLLQMETQVLAGCCKGLVLILGYSHYKYESSTLRSNKFNTWPKAGRHNFGSR